MHGEILCILTNRAMMASRWFQLVALPTEPDPLIRHWVCRQVTEFQRIQWVGLPSLLIDSRPPIRRYTTRIGQNNRKVTPQ